MEATMKSGLIYSLIPKVMKAIGHVAKERKNQQQGYQFRGIDDFYAAVQGPFADHGIFCVPSVTERSVTERPTKSGGVLFYTTLTVKHSFFAEDGSSVEAVTVGEAMDSGDKSSNKAMSAAMKYALIELFSIPTWEPENDADSQTHEPAAANPKAAPAKTAPVPSAKLPDGVFDEMRKMLHEAFEAAEFAPDDQKRCVGDVLKAKKKKTLQELSLDQFNGFIKAIATHQMDKYKSPATAAA